MFLWGHVMGLILKEVLHHTKRLQFIFPIGYLNRFSLEIFVRPVSPIRRFNKILSLLKHWPFLFSPGQSFSKDAVFTTCCDNDSGMTLVFETAMIILQPVIGAFETGSVCNKYGIFLYSKRSVTANPFNIYIQH